MVLYKAEKGSGFIWLITSTSLAPKAECLVAYISGVDVGIHLPDTVIHVTYLNSQGLAKTLPMKKGCVPSYILLQIHFF